ncbi:MAG: DUF1569 domain-containing protein [Phycisphaerales bacterium]|jgi:hypothetical protein|nr:DUF1569 domain-containing protein [Phycisphaerales bacterium]
MSTIETGKVHERRALRFENFAGVRRDLDALHAGISAGTFRTSGNWSAAQVFNHLAAFMEYPFDGYPPEIARPPWFIRFLSKFMRRRMCFGRMPSGVKIPRVNGGTVGFEDSPVDAAEARLRAAIDRLDREAPTRPSPLFGPMSHEEWKGLNLRHCELHLSFVHPK